MVRLVCPTCASVTWLKGDGEQTACPRCGSSLRAPGELDPASDELLVADLRDAFAHQTTSGKGASLLRAPGKFESSAAFLRPLQADTLPPGTLLGDDFEIIDELGRGGMGVVYRARQRSLDRVVALKVLPGYTRYGSTAVERFRTEAQAAARLHHTNVVSVFAQGEQGGHCYYAMELIEGTGLDTVIRSRPDVLTTCLGRRPAPQRGQDPDSSALAFADSAARVVPVDAEPAERLTQAEYRRLASLVAEAADALEHAHRLGVIHRDVKPHNLLLGHDHRLHLTDFGLARLTDTPHLTVSGEMMGTPAYLSPEQVKGKPGGIDHRTDIYSLGVTLYELITRRKPFDGETREQIITGIRDVEPTAPRRFEPHIPVDLETICLRALEKDPARRHPTAGELAEDLRRFAQGMPILSRRISLAERAGKWVRRHKAVSTALAAGAAVIVLAVGLAWSLSVVTAGQRREADRLLQDAYEQLAFVDYRTPELVQAKIERAGSGGVDETLLHLTQALAYLGAYDEQSALKELDAAEQLAPKDPRTWYLRSWAQWRGRQRADSRRSFDEGEALGPPHTPDTWFFRGLAIHYDDGEAAIESYRRANALRAEEHAFYPQAILHQARAYNQQLYATRSIESFSEAKAALLQLIEYGYYDAYPYYLLSVAHRLAAEIYRGSRGTRDDSLVEEHFAAALDWARRGQEFNPTDDRCLAAEAECLESMGLMAEALAARTRMIELGEQPEFAAEPQRRCEGYYYRWRLHYWLGDFEAALIDLDMHLECDPSSIFCAHVYPALVLAEMGEFEAAQEHARSLSAENPDSAWATLWSATCLRLLGQTEEAETLLAERADLVDYEAELVPPQSPEWMKSLYRYCMVGGSLDELEGQAATARQPWRLWGEANFHAAALKLAQGDRTAAMVNFERAYRSFDGEERYTYHARVVCEKLRQTPDWPSWIVVSSTGASDPGSHREAGNGADVAGEGFNEHY